MKQSRLPRKSGPCAEFQIARGTKFCGVCGHTNGAHGRKQDDRSVQEILDDRITSIIGRQKK